MTQRTRIGWIVPAALLGVPLVEIALFILVGNRIGLWATIGLVIATAVAGSLLIRLQGVAVLTQARAKLDRGEPPVVDMFHALGLLTAGILLLTPGFLTDALGFLLLIPGTRWAIGAFIWRRLQAANAVRADDGVIEGEFTHVDPDTGPEPSATKTRGRTLPTDSDPSEGHDDEGGGTGSPWRRP